MGLTLSTTDKRRRRKTTSATNVDYHELNGNDVSDCVLTSSHRKVGRAKRASRLLAALTGRKSVATVATFPADSDVISGNGAQCWQQQKKNTEYNEVTTN